MFGIVRMCLLRHLKPTVQMTPKAEQHSAMEAIYDRQDVFVRLPFGYGKSLC